MNPPANPDAELRQQIRHILRLCVYTPDGKVCNHMPAGGFEDEKDVDKILSLIAAHDAAQGGVRIVPPLSLGTSLDKIIDSLITRETYKGSVNRVRLQLKAAIAVHDAELLKAFEEIIGEDEPLMTIEGSRKYKTSSLKNKQRNYLRDEQRQRLQALKALLNNLLHYPYARTIPTQPRESAPRSVK